MGNTVSMNKNCYTMACALEMVQENVLDLVRVSFMIAVHTSSTPIFYFPRSHRLSIVVMSSPQQTFKNWLDGLLM